MIIFKKGQRDGIHIEDVKNVGGEWLVTGHTGFKGSWLALWLNRGKKNRLGV